VVAKSKKFSPGFISLADMYLAYKKAKADSFFDNLHPSTLLFVEFEKNLRGNLEGLLDTLTMGEADWWADEKILGEYLYIPKAIDESPWENRERAHYRSVDPLSDWQLRFDESGETRLAAEYRLIIAATVEFQIISALWILKVGNVFEEKLDKDLSYGNRLRRRRGLFPYAGDDPGSLNLESLGFFTPYFSAYRNWRGNGLDAMRSMVSEGKSVTAITMDLASFYHSASPDFITRPSFLKKIGVSLSSDQKSFTKLLLQSIHNWYRNTPDYKDRPEGALPVGLSASKIISNVLLFELDAQVNEGISPSYYGRYVDDIFLVFETPDEVSGGDSALEYLAKKIDCLKIIRVKGAPPDLRLKFGYASDSDLRFKASKQKIFSLSSEHGIDLIDQISSQIRAQSSEYRMLPEVPINASAMAEKALLASPDASLIADALRKADVVSVRRLGLSLLIRDIESYSTDLSRAEWGDVRNEFYGLVERHILTPKGLFELFSYMSRVLRLMISNYDFDQAVSFIDSLEECFDLLENTTVRVKGGKEKHRLCKRYFSKVLLQTVMQASTSKGFDQWVKLRLCIKRLLEFSSIDGFSLAKRSLEAKSYSLLLADLGARPYKDFWYYSQSEDINKVKVPRAREVRKVLRLASVRKFREAARLKLPHWPALAFPTRPLSIQEIALVNPAVLDDNLLFRRAIYGLRGAKTLSGGSITRSLTNDGCRIKVPNKPKDSINIALTNVETTTKQFSLAVSGTPDRSLVRYERLNGLINGILSSKPHCNYVVFPELSIPRRWAIGIASKLARQGISLISGIEYYLDSSAAKTLRNDCMVSLATRWPGYSSNFLFMQPKLAPSHGEAKTLNKAKKKQYIPSAPNETLPIYDHGGFHFGVLVCSDMTGPENRMRFQGKVDSLFVLEWNPDVKTFSSLVEAASYDVHAFIVQVNNRMYGDSRVRAPYRIEYKRDSVRIKGGLSDYSVVANIDYHALRRFQRKRDMTDKSAEFKPVPIGFKMCPLRRNGRLKKSR